MAHARDYSAGQASHARAASPEKPRRAEGQKRHGQRGGDNQKQAGPGGSGGPGLRRVDRRGGQDRKMAYEHDHRKAQGFAGGIVQDRRGAPALDRPIDRRGQRQNQPRLIHSPKPVAEDGSPDKKVEVQHHHADPESPNQRRGAKEAIKRAFHNANLSALDRKRSTPQGSVWEPGPSYDAGRAKVGQALYPKAAARSPSCRSAPLLLRDRSRRGRRL